MFKNIRTCLFIFFVSFYFSGCITTPVNISESTTPIHNKKIEKKLGKTSGSHSVYSVLGLWMMGRPDFDLAIKDALAKKNGDALINVRFYETYTWYLFFSITEIHVEGEAVKFSEIGDKNEKKR